MTDAEQKILDNEFEDVLLLDNFSYDSALIGVSTDNRAVYDYNKMIEWLVDKEKFTEEEAIEWIDYNTLRALPYYQDAPIIMFPLID